MTSPIVHAIGQPQWLMLRGPNSLCAPSGHWPFGAVGGAAGKSWGSCSTTDLAKFWSGLGRGCSLLPVGAPHAVSTLDGSRSTLGAWLRHAPWLLAWTWVPRPLVLHFRGGSLALVGAPSRDSTSPSPTSSTLVWGTSTPRG